MTEFIENQVVLTHYEKIDTSNHGKKGVLITLISREVVEDSYLDLGELLVKQVVISLPDITPAMFLVDFLALLNKQIPPMSDTNNLALRHSIQYVDEETIGVNLYPAIGGSYHIPIQVVGKTADEVVGEVWKQFGRAVVISQVEGRD